MVTIFTSLLVCAARSNIVQVSGGDVLDKYVFLRIDMSALVCNLLEGVSAESLTRVKWFHFRKHFEGGFLLFDCLKTRIQSLVVNLGRSRLKSFVFLTLF